MSAEPRRRPEPAAPTPNRVRPAGVYARRLKPAADRVAAAVLLVAAAPLMAVGGLLVRATSPGPAVYRQTRLGRAGRPFTIYKLRSMRNDCEAQSGVRWAVPGDARVTAVGRVLRATHLDELPQLWNVVRGEMSLIGPRPERPEIAAGLAEAVPGYEDRLAVKPGVSGLAQVLLPADTDLDGVRRKLVADRAYVARQTAWLDLRLLAATVAHVLALPPWWIRSCLWLPVPTTVFAPAVSAGPPPAQAMAEPLSYVTSG